MDNQVDTTPQNTRHVWPFIAEVVLSSRRHIMLHAQCTYNTFV